METTEILARFAPGTKMRSAIERILQQGTGALIVLGWDAGIAAVCSGGVGLANAEFTPQRIAELAKMDGGIVVDPETDTIIRANIQFIPDPAIDTNETGTRHRTAERVAVQTGHPVVTVSEGRRLAIVYFDGIKHELRTPGALLADANQTLNSLERFRRRVSIAESHLTRLEVDDEVLMADVVILMQRGELVQRLNDGVEQLAIELGGEAELLRLQAADLTEGVGDLLDLIYADYAKEAEPGFDVHAALEPVGTEDLYEASKVSAVLGLGALDNAIQPRGLRALAGVPRLPLVVRDSLIEHFGDFQKLLYAPVSELATVEGVGRTRARQLRAHLDRLLGATLIGDL